MGIAVVTGGAQGIGRAIAKRLDANGHQVIVVDRQAARDPAFVADQVVMDLCEPGAVAHVYRQLPETFDILVNCAGIYPTTPALDIAEEEWLNVLTLDLTVPFFMSQQAARRWVAQRHKGVIVQISSTAATVVRPGIAHYGGAKAGLSMLTRVLAVEWAPYGIRVNAVGPGLVVTETGEDMLRNPAEQTRHAQKLARIPMGRTADSDEIAHMVQFLVSDQADYITGQTIYVDGGYTAGFPFDVAARP